MVWTSSKSEPVASLSSSSSDVALGSVSPERIARGYEIVRRSLLSQRNSLKHWTGELSTSALATATAVMALRMMALRKQDPDAPIETLVDRPLPPITSRPVRSLIERGVEWLAAHQNADGGWGDTIKSVSNISTAMLVRAVLQPSDLRAKYVEVVEAADRYIERAGGIDAVIRRYGKDKTFSIPILTHCASRASSIGER
jgi:squalene-hopene/tetraprenyl-beta-curcumene cyclase